MNNKSYNSFKVKRTRGKIIKISVQNIEDEFEQMLRKYNIKGRLIIIKPNYVKASYNNSFCMNVLCEHYFEDTCELALQGKNCNIYPYDASDICYEENSCPQFKRGKHEGYNDIEDTEKK